MRVTTLVGGYPIVPDPTGRARLQPAAELSGYRDSRLVVSILIRGASLGTAVDQLKLACRTLAALEVDSAALLAGDEFALTVSASADHPSDLIPFVLTLTWGPPGIEPAGRLLPYQFDRHSGTVTWGTPRPVRASRTQGLWAQVLGPMCVDRAAASEAELADLLEENRRLGHVVLRL